MEINSIFDNTAQRMEQERLRDERQARRRRIFKSPSINAIINKFIDSWPPFEMLTYRYPSLESNEILIIGTQIIQEISDAADPINVLLTAAYSVDTWNGQRKVPAITFKVYDLDYLRKHCKEDLDDRGLPNAECMADREGYANDAALVCIFDESKWSPIDGYRKLNWRTEYLVWDEFLMSKIELITQRKLYMEKNGKEIEMPCRVFLELALKAAHGSDLTDWEWDQICFLMTSLSSVFKSEDEIQRRTSNRAMHIVRVKQGSIF